MRVGGGSVVARETELAFVERFIDDIGDGPDALVLEGHAGVGKTVIWNHARAYAESADVQVRTCRCSQSDTGLAFAGLGDLLDGLDSAQLAALPEVQEQALSAALLISDPGDDNQPAG